MRAREFQHHKFKCMNRMTLAFNFTLFAHHAGMTSSQYLTSLEIQSEKGEVVEVDVLTSDCRWRGRV